MLEDRLLLWKHVSIDAIMQIRTVYMKGEFYKQSPFECWMRFDGDPDHPTHVWLGWPNQNLCKICSPEGVFGLNRRTHRVHYAARDEHDKSWFPRFGSSFRDVVQQAGTNDAIRIDEDKDVITVRVNASKRRQEFLIDPATKLLIRFTTICEDDPAEMMRWTLALKNLTEIRYNEQPLAGLFEKPADGVVVEQEVDCMVDPDSGLVANGVTPEQACLAIVKKAG